MKQIAIIYGSTTGNTEKAAEMIKQHLSESSTIASVNNFDWSTLSEIDALILGTSTWGAGDIQDDWDAALSTLKSQDLTDKEAALFGLGDAAGFSDTFVDGIADLAEAVKEAGAKLTGTTDSEGYVFDESRALTDGKFLGLVLDEDNQDDLTEERIASWTARLKKEWS